jgi:hypothetical protein
MVETANLNRASQLYSWHLHALVHENKKRLWLSTHPYYWIFRRPFCLYSTG